MIVYGVDVTWKSQSGESESPYNDLMNDFVSLIMKLIDNKLY